MSPSFWVGWLGLVREMIGWFVVSLFNFVG